MNSRRVTAMVALASLVVAGVALRPIVRPLTMPQANAQEGAASVLGRLRTFAADLAWVRAQGAWERRDAPATESLLRMTTTLDPRPLYFWLNGARMMAYDLPVWRIAAEGGFDSVPQERQVEIEREQARRALVYLEEARQMHPTASALWIEAANIELNRLHDVAAAAESYRRAAELADAPYFAARIHAELLRRMGRKREALDWLVKLYPTLPANNEAAAADVVRQRIRELKRELGVTTWEQ